MKRTYAALPLVSPCLLDGTPDTRSMGNLAFYYYEAGIRDFFICGTTGRQMWWNPNERGQYLHAVRETLPEDACLLAGCSAPSLPQMLEHARIAQANGADIVVITPPPGCCYNAAELYKLFAPFGDFCLELGAKAAVYNIPGIGLSEIPPELVIKLADHPAYVVYKNSGSRRHFKTVIAAIEEQDVAYLEGCEPFIASTLRAGGRGFVSSLMHLNPKPFLALLQAAKDGNWKEAARLQAAITSVHQLVTPWYEKLGSTSAIYHFLNVVVKRIHACNLMLPHEGKTPKALKQDALKAVSLLDDSV